MPTPFTAEALWRLPRVGQPAAGGGRIVVPVTTFEDNVGTTRIFEVFANGATPRPLTSAAASATKPSVSPDGSRLAFLRKHEEHDQIHVMRLDGGEAERITDLPLGSLGALWAPDGESLVVVAPVLADHPDVDDTAAERERRTNDPVTARTTEHAVYRFWDRWLTGLEVPHLFWVDRSTHSIRDITPGSRRWMRWDNTDDPLADVAISPDGGQVAFCADRSDPPHRELRWALYTVDISTERELCLTPEHEGHVSRPRYSPDGALLVYGRTEDPHFYADRVRLVARDRNSGQETILTETWDRSPSSWEFDDSTLVFAAEDDARQPVWRMPMEQTTPEMVCRDGTLSWPIPLADGSIIAHRSSMLSPPELALVADGEARQITSFAALTEVDLPTVEDVRFGGAAGDEIQMFVVRPPSEHPLPLVHLIHGGPHGIFGDTWHWRWNAAVFAGTTRAVALVNFHGSTSWGQDFAACIRGAWGDLPAGDIEAATDHLVSTGVADPSRIAITGGSYGGYLVAWLVSQTDRYVCAVAHAAVTSLPGMYASDVTAGRAEAYGAEVWDDLDRILRWSPSAHTAGYTTPTLVVHGERDYRVPVGQGLELYGVLKAKGVGARLVYFPDENHWILSPANSMYWYGEVLGWLERHGIC